LIFYSGGAQEIAKSMAQYIRRDDPDVIKLNSKVTSIALREDVPQEDVPYVEVVTNNTEHHKFSHVISTLPLPALRILDLSRAGLTPMQSNAMRHLTYDSSIKIGLQFETAWWTTAIDLNGTPLNIIGGQTYTDTPLRTVVYPSFGDVQAGKTTTLIASYCWTDDAQRLGGMIGKDDETLKELALRELAKIHNLDVVFLRRQLLGYMAWNWTQDPYTMGKYSSVFRYYLWSHCHFVKAPLLSLGPENLEISIRGSTALLRMVFSILLGRPSACAMRGWRVRWIALGEPSRKCYSSLPSKSTKIFSTRTGG
jgi:monoamine oxidase